MKGNHLKDLKAYFLEQLNDRFSESEIQLICKVSVCQRLGVKEQDFFLHQDALFSESDLLFFRSLVKRLQQDEPFQYVIGDTEFYGLRLKTDRRALIPRPETEELVDWILQEEKGKSGLHIADLCSGTGCIALALKANLRDSTVRAFEYSLEALELMRENAAYCELEIDLVHMDVLVPDAFQSFANESFDVWVSNPPYIPIADREQMQPNVLNFEPEMALFVPDEDALLFYRCISVQARRCLKPGGWLYFEIHENLGPQLLSLMESSGFVNIELRKDLQGKNRMLRAQKRNFTS